MSFTEYKKATIESFENDIKNLINEKTILKKDEFDIVKEKTSYVRGSTIEILEYAGILQDILALDGIQRSASGKVIKLTNSLNTP